MGEGGPRLAAPGQLLGCSSAAARTLDVPGYLYLGTGVFHPLTVALATGKPVVAYIDSIGASGGLYAAMGADAVISQPTAIVGSIGVIMQSMDLSRAIAAFGIDGIAEAPTFTRDSIFDAGADVLETYHRAT